jgi:tape measure domain-containing protein
VSGNQFKLDVLITAVDKFTAPLTRMSKNLEAIAAPGRRISNAFASVYQAAGADRLVSSFKNVGSAIAGVGDAAEQTGKRLLIAFGSIGGVVFGFKRELVDVADNIQGIALSLKGLEGGSVAKTTADMSFIKGLSLKSPFSLETLANTFQQMKAMKLDPLHQMQGLVDFGAAFKLPAENINRIAIELSEAMNMGKLQARQIRALAQEKVPIWSLLQNFIQRTTGKKTSVAELMDASEKGHLGKGAITGVFDEMEFENPHAAERMAKGTVSGQLNVLSNMSKIFRANVMGINDAGEAAAGKPMDVLQNGLGRLSDAFAKMNSDGTLATFQDWLSTKITKALTYVIDKIFWLVQNGPQAFDNITKKLQPFVDVANNLAAAVGGWQRVGLFAAAAYFGGPLLGAVGKLAMAFASLASAIGLTPAGWILSALVALGAAAAVLVNDWGSFGNYFVNLWKDVKDVLGGALEMIRGVLSATKDLAHFNFKGALADLGRGLAGAERMGGGLWHTTKGVGTGIANTGSAVGDFLTSKQHGVTFNLPSFGLPTQGPAASGDNNGTGSPAIGRFGSMFKMLGAPSFMPAAPPLGGGAGSSGGGDRLEQAIGAFQDAVRTFAQSRVKVDIDFTNLPPGTKTRVDQSGTIDVSRGVAMAHAY